MNIIHDYTHLLFMSNSQVTKIENILGVSLDVIGLISNNLIPMVADGGGIKELRGGIEALKRKKQFFTPPRSSTTGLFKCGFNTIVGPRL